MALGMGSYATHNNAIVLNATGSKQVSKGQNSVNIYGKEVLINGSSIEFDGMTNSLKSIKIGNQTLDDILNARIS